MPLNASQTELLRRHASQVPGLSGLFDSPWVGSHSDALETPGAYLLPRASHLSSAVFGSSSRGRVVHCDEATGDRGKRADKIPIGTVSMGLLSARHHRHT